MIRLLLLAGLGGGIGTMARYLCSKWISENWAQSFPLGTFLVNIAGCLLIGLCWGWFSGEMPGREQEKMIWMTGFCGGFTTFSAFTLEGVGLLKENKTGLFLAYTAASVILGLTATFIGIKIAK